MVSEWTVLSVYVGQPMYWNAMHCNARNRIAASACCKLGAVEQDLCVGSSSAAAVFAAVTEDPLLQLAGAASEY